MQPLWRPARSSDRASRLIDKTRQMAGFVVSGTRAEEKLQAISLLRQVIAKKGNFSLDSFALTGKMARLSRGYVVIHMTC